MSDQTLQRLSQQVGERLLARKATLATAESCTGGWIAKVITDVAGSSAWYTTGFVTYSERAKQLQLGVSRQTLQQWGAVSEQVASEMALGACQRAESDYALSVTGVAGPGGGSEDTPVGTVWFAIAQGNAQVITELQYFTGSRESVRYQAVIWILNRLLHLLEKN